MNWKTIKSEYVLNNKWIKVRADKCRMPNGQIIDPYYVLEYPAWINVFGITKDNNVVLVKLYRHGVRKTVLELPCGVMEGSDKTPMDAAKRELLEETGYTSDNFIQTGIVSPNTSNHQNYTYCFLAQNLEKTADPKPDITEEIVTHLVPLKNAVHMLKNGEFLQALHVSSVFYALSYLKKI